VEESSHLAADGSRFLHNFGNYIASDTASHPHTAGLAMQNVSEIRHDCLNDTNADGSEENSQGETYRREIPQRKTV
jgi:hypothetical protein